jgi:hypothetical protein
MPSHPDPDEEPRADLDRIVDAHLRAEHDGDLPAILDLMTDGIVHDVVGSIDGPIQGLDAVRLRYRDLLAATVHERDTPVRRLYGTDFVLDERIWHGRLIGHGFDADGHGRWLSHRVLWLLEIHDGRIGRETVWNDLAAIRRQLT